MCLRPLSIRPDVVGKRVNITLSSCLPFLVDYIYQCRNWSWKIGKSDLVRAVGVYGPVARTLTSCIGAPLFHMRSNSRVLRGRARIHW